jgi:hypothetical protein
MKPDTGALARLQAWYVAQIDGDWEHQYGVTIETLDNPGWSLKVDLHNTTLLHLPFEQIERTGEAGRWLTAWREPSVFRAACGPLDLERAIEAFLSWSAGD